MARCGGVSVASRVLTGWLSMCGWVSITFRLLFLDFQLVGSFGEVHPKEGHCVFVVVFA